MTANGTFPSRARLVQAVFTAVSWAIFSVLCWWGMVAGRDENGLGGSVLMGVVGLICMAGMFGALVGLWAKGWNADVRMRGDVVYEIHSQWLTIQGCELRRLSELGEEVSSFHARSPATQVRDHHLERWVVHCEGSSTERHRFLAKLYNWGRDAPRVTSSLSELGPPRRGEIYLVRGGWITAIGSAEPDDRSIA